MIDLPRPKTPRQLLDNMLKVVDTQMTGNDTETVFVLRKFTDDQLSVIRDFLASFDTGEEWT